MSRTVESINQKTGRTQQLKCWPFTTPRCVERYQNLGVDIEVEAQFRAPGWERRVLRLFAERGRLWAERMEVVA
jgi:hypothetical protein